MYPEQRENYGCHQGLALVETFHQSSSGRSSQPEGTGEEAEVGQSSFVYVKSEIYLCGSRAC